MLAIESGNEKSDKTSLLPTAQAENLDERKKFIMIR